MANNPMLDSQLWGVVRNDDVPGLLALLKKGANPNIKGSPQLRGSRTGNHPIRESLYDAAFEHESWGVFEALLKAKVKFPAATATREGIWEKALSLGKEPALRLIMKYHARYTAAGPLNKMKEPTLVQALNSAEVNCRLDHPIVSLLMTRPGRWSEPDWASLADIMVVGALPPHTFQAWAERLGAQNVWQQPEVQKRVWLAMCFRPEQQASMVLEWMRTLAREDVAWSPILDERIKDPKLSEFRQRWQTCVREVSLEKMSPPPNASSSRRFRA